jgi:hypothetical protein
VRALLGWANALDHHDVVDLPGWEASFRRWFRSTLSGCDELFKRCKADHTWMLSVAIIIASVFLSTGSNDGDAMFDLSQFA